MIFLYILLAILALLIILVLVAPKKYNVHRSITINKSVPEVYQYLSHIKNQDHWSPWKQRDPNMKQTFTGEDGTVGFVSRWESDHKQVGHGEQEIMGMEANKRIDTALRFLKPWKSESSAYMETHEADGGGTKVVWGFYGTHKVPMNVMMMFFNMDKAVGKDFEEGLDALKKVLEN